MTTGRPVAEGIFTWPSEEPRLLGCRCQQCGTTVFPSQGACPRCASEEMQAVELEGRGTLWTWTIQGFPPPSPPYARQDALETFRPFGVGYVELPGQVMVEARLTEADPAQLAIGMEMELVIEPLTEDDDGVPLLTYAFRPIGTGRTA